MARTIDEPISAASVERPAIAERVRHYQDDPRYTALPEMVNGVERTLSAAEREATFARWADADEARDVESAAREKAAGERDTLIAHLEAGSASSRDVQAALAALLRREAG